MFIFDVFMCSCNFFFFKQKTAYEMRISDWSSDVCSSDLEADKKTKDQAQIIIDLQGKLVSGADQLDKEKQLTADARSQIDLLNRQILALRQQLGELDRILKESEAKEKASEAQVADLGKRLNAALARKVDELQNYRSEFRSAEHTSELQSLMRISYAD